MTSMALNVDVPESRQVTITLPPDTPTGPVRLTVVAEVPGEAYKLPRFVADSPDPGPRGIFFGQLRVIDPKRPA